MIGWEEKLFPKQKRKNSDTHMVCKTNNKNQKNNGAMKHKHFRSGCLLDKETITTIYLFHKEKLEWAESRKVPVAVEEGLLH